MSKLILQPTGNPQAYKHYTDSILNPVSLETMRPFLRNQEAAQLEELYKGKAIPTWGLTPGKTNQNAKMWSRMEPGDTALFLRKNTAFASGVVSYKLHNKPLAESLWGNDSDGYTWEYMYFLDEMQNQDIPYKQLNSSLGYADNYNYRPARLREDEQSDAIISELQLGSETYGPTPSKEEYIRAIAPATGAPLDKLVTAKARQEQAYLRYILFGRKKYFDCSICGRNFPVSMLIAAHIKRRSECSYDERKDYKNIALPMCKFGCDELYEKGYIGVRKGMICAIKDANLTPPVLEYLENIDSNKVGGLKTGNAPYIEWHNAHLALPVESDL